MNQSQNKMPLADARGLLFFARERVHDKPAS